MPRGASKAARVEVKRERPAERRGRAPRDPPKVDWSPKAKRGLDRLFEEARKHGLAHEPFGSLDD